MKMWVNIVLCLRGAHLLQGGVEEHVDVRVGEDILYPQAVRQRKSQTIIPHPGALETRTPPPMAEPFRCLSASATWLYELLLLHGYLSSAWF